MKVVANHSTVAAVDCEKRSLLQVQVLPVALRKRIALCYLVSGEHSRSLKTACVLTTRMPIVPRS